jgi:hypothetical protein
MGTVFVCVVCGSVVCGPVEPLEDPKQIGRKDGEPAVPRGRFATADPLMEGSFGGWYMLNLADAVGTKPHRESGRWNGCCGADGMDGKNTLCEKGHEIGTECSDCWMAHALMLDPKSVEMKKRD